METEKVVVPGALVEVMLVLGMDQCTGLTVLNHMEDDDIFSGLYEQEYDINVLTAISATDMVDFNPFPRVDSSYPPNNSSATSPLPENVERGRIFSTVEELSSKKRSSSFKPGRGKLKRSVSYNPKMFARQGSVFRKSVKKKVTPTTPELPISEEVMRSIPSFCFPDGARVHEQSPGNSCHFLVLTDMTGIKTYTTCLTFYRRYLVEKDDGGNMYMEFNMSTSSQDLAEKTKIGYIPYCCVTVSKHPYFTVMKECLSRMLMQIEQDPKEMYTFIKNFAQYVTMTPVPPAGKVSIDINVYQLPLRLMPASHVDRQVVDIPLYMIFLCFPVTQIVNLLSCVLVEERLVFLSDNYALLTIIMETVANMIVPFRWRFTYVPILSSRCLEYLQAPGTFMFGCHRKHKQEAEQVSGLVMIDIDEGTVTRIPENSQDDVNGLPGNEFLLLPQEPARVFITKCKHFGLQFDCIEAQRPSCYDLEEMRQFRIQKIQKSNAAILSTSLELMVNLFRGVGAKLRRKQTQSHFNKREFLNEQPPECQAFYGKVFQTDMFKLFLEDRIKDKNDVWSEFEMKTRKELLSSGAPVPSLSRMQLRRRSTLSQITFITTPTPSWEVTPLNLPDILDTESYVPKTIVLLTNKIKECKDFDSRTSYVYLRCLFHAAAGNQKASLEDMVTLMGSNSRLVPTVLLKETHDSMTEIDLRGFVSRQGYSQLLDILEELENEEGHLGHKQICMDPVPIPKRDLGFEDFVDCIYHIDMTQDYDTIQRLFEALKSKPRATYVLHERLSNCVIHWEENLKQLGLVKIEESRLEPTEDLLKLSGQVKTDFGIGRVGLTAKRLFFLKDVSSTYKEIARLKDIQKIEKTQQTAFLSNVDSIQVTRKDDTVFSMQVKEERNWWYMVLYEVWAGKVISMVTKDLMAITNAAHNALLIDALIGSGQDSLVSSTDVFASARHMAYYTTMMEEKKHILPRNMQEALQHRIDPNCGDRERKAVQALLYTEGTAAVSPRLWVGLSNGRVRVYDALSWILETEFVQTKQCVACLTSVGKGQVWAGSRGIFIIDTETITCNKTLLNHLDLVVDIVPYKDGRYIYSASLDGTIIQWNVDELKPSKPPIHLKDVRELRCLKIHDDQLWCGTWKNILLVNLKGEIIHEFQYKDANNKTVQVDSFVVLPNNEMWVGCRRDEAIVIWDTETKRQKEVISVKGSGIGTLAVMCDRIWVGTKSGTILIFTIASRKEWKVLENAHDDAIRVLCNLMQRYVISGASSKDGKIAIWSATANTTESGNFPEIETHF